MNSKQCIRFIAIRFHFMALEEVIFKSLTILLSFSLSTIVCSIFCSILLTTVFCTNLKATLKWRLKCVAYVSQMNKHLFRYWSILYARIESGPQKQKTFLDFGIKLICIICVFFIISDMRGRFIFYVYYVYFEIL